MARSLLPRFGHPISGAAFVVALLVLSTTPFLGNAGGTGGSAALGVHPATAIARILAVHPPPLGFGHSQPVSLPRPSLGSEYYTQEGATISQINDSSATGVSRLGEFVRLVNSPYSTAYELNGLTNSGDWWQIVVADNWPGCNSGLEEATEVWDSTGVSGAITCDSTLTLSAGDLVEFTLTFQSGNGCLGLRDVTTTFSHTICQAQPDSGGTKWNFLSTSSDSNGYYSGPMTEVINMTTSACPDNTYMPRVAYLYASGTYVTNYVAWSDEFVFGGSVCYQTSENGQAIFPGDPASYYADTASGTSYGPHWVDGQNYSLLDPSYGFRFETDPIPLTSVSLSGSPLTPVAGQLVNFTATVAGGVTPYQALWKLNGALQPIANASWSWRAGLAGSYSVVAYGVDKQNDVLGPSNTVVITVPGPLQVTGVTASPVNGTDVGLIAQFSVVVSGGFGYWVVNWSGLPAGCLPANRTLIGCAPTTPGTTIISVSVRDANGSVVSSGPLPYRVFPAFQVGLTPSATALDLGQTVTVVANLIGGSGGNRLSWSTTIDCSSQGASVSCTPTSVAPLIVALTASDSAGSNVPASVAITVNPSLVVTVPTPRVFADVGGVFSTRVVVAGGSAPFGYVWGGLPTGCSVDGPVANCSLPALQNLEVQATVLDAAGVAVLSPAVEVVAAAAPTLGVNVTEAPVLVGDTVTFSASAHGGTAPFAYVWTNLPEGCPALQASTITCVPSAPGNYTVTVAGTDAANSTVRASTQVSVQPFAGSGGNANGGIPSLGSTGLWVVVLVGMAVAVAAVALWARRRRYR